MSFSFLLEYSTRGLSHSWQVIAPRVDLEKLWWFLVVNHRLLPGSHFIGGERWHVSVSCDYVFEFIICAIVILPTGCSVHGVRDELGKGLGAPTQYSPHCLWHPQRRAIKSTIITVALGGNEAILVAETMCPLILLHPQSDGSFTHILISKGKTAWLPPYGKSQQ